MKKAHVFDNGCYTDEIGNLFDENGHILEEVGTDADFDRYAVEVMNGNGYYDDSGHYRSYGRDD